MGSRADKLQAEHGQYLRLTLFGCIAVGIIAYPILIAAKLAWGIPDRAWWRIAVGPVLPFGVLLLPMWLLSRHDLREARRADDLA